MRNVENSRGLAGLVGQLQQRDDALAVDHAQQVGGLELGLAEEVLAARGLQVDQGAQDHPGRRRRRRRRCP